MLPIPNIASGPVARQWVTMNMLDIILQRVRILQHQRVKYACVFCDQGIKVTPAPVRIIPKGLLTEATLAWVVTANVFASQSRMIESGLAG